MKSQPAYMLITCLLTIFLVYPTKGQSSLDIDSLISSIQRIDTSRHHRDSLWRYSHTLLNSSTADTSKSRIYFAWGNYYLDKFQYDSSKILLEQAIELFKKEDSTSLNLGNAYYSLGNLLYDIGDIEKAIKTYHKALHIFDLHGTTDNKGHTYNAIGNAYAYLSETFLSIDNYRKAISIHQAETDSDMVSMVYGNMASVYTVKEEYDSSIYYYEKGLLWARDDKLLQMDHLLGIGIVKEETEIYDGAEAYYREALRLALEADDPIQTAYIYQNLAFLFLATEKLDSIPKYLALADSIAEKCSVINLQLNLKEIKHELLYKQGMYREAYNLMTEVREETDSIYDLELTRELQEVQAQYDILQRQQEMAMKDLALEQTNYQLAQNRTERNALIIGFLLVLGIGVSLYRSRMLKSKANRLLKVKNQEIEDKNEKIQAIEEAKTRWFVNISHELRTPLTLVKGPIRQAIQSIPKNDHIYKDLQMADRNVSKLQNLVNEILDLSKMEEGKMVLKKDAADINEMILNIVASFDHLARETKVKLELDIDPENTLYLLIDRKQIEKVLTNLMANAMKFTHEGGTITLGVKTEDLQLKAYVRDTGEGISEADVPHIFDRFYQSSNPKTGRSGGTGVGLSLCREIARLHEGDLVVKSKLGEGSTFELILPTSIIQKKDVSPQKEKPVDNETVRDGYGSLLKDKVVMIVDDNADMRTYIAGFLKTDYKIIEARDGVEALDKLAEQVPDLIVSDIMMPRMDGITFAKKVKEHKAWSQIPFITVSAIEDESEKVSTLRIGIDDYVVKPFFAEELHVRIGNLIKNYAERQSFAKSQEADEYLSYEEQLLKKLEKEVYEHINDTNYNVLRLAEAAAMSERQLYRYIKQMTGLTPANFIKEIRLQRAMELIQKRVYKRTSQISYAVGFPQPAYFSTVFKKRFGRMPADYIES